MMNAILVAASFSLVTFGFASWIVDGSVDEDKENISVTISETNDETLIVEFVNNNDTDLSVTFDSNGKSQSSKLPGEGLYITSDSNGEDLSFVLTYNLISFDDLVNDSNIKVTVEFTNKDDFSILSSPKNYVDTACIKDFSFTLNNPYSLISNDKKYVETTVTSTLKNSNNFRYYELNITQKFTFYWGSVFNGLNPSEYENTTVEDLLGFIELGKNLNNVKLEVLIKGERI